MNKKIGFAILITMLLIVPVAQTTANDNEEDFVLEVHNLYTSFTLPIEGYTAKSLMNVVPGFNIILSYDSDNDEFIMINENFPDSYDFELEPGVGYILISFQYEGPVTLSGVPVESVTVNLERGWNSIGNIKEEPIDLESIYSSIQHCCLVIKWNNTRGEFDVYVPGSPYGSINVYKGEAVFVAVTQESVWSQ